MSAFISSCLFDLLKASWQGGVLILLVLGSQWVFGRRLNPRWRYGLWLLVVIRLALPWTVPSSVSLFNVLNPFAKSPPPAVAKPMPGNDTSPRPQSTADAPAKQPAAASTVQSDVFPWLNWKLAWLLGVWFMGASTLVIDLLVTQRRISRRVVSRQPWLDEAVLNLLEDCKQQRGVRVPIVIHGDC